MGILNVTPDSFSDGGHYLWLEDAIRQAHLMVDEGADLIDVGGESTRPGSSPVTVEVELKRIIPLIRRLSEEVSVPISVDTSKPEVMKAAVEAGAAMINDICALRMPGLMVSSVLALQFRHNQRPSFYPHNNLVLSQLKFLH